MSILLSLALIAQSPASADSASDLLPPTRVLCAGQPIDVTTGHAAPYRMDFDGDGLIDLLVGEFGDGAYPVDRLPVDYQDSDPGDYALGKLRIYRNSGTNTQPRFEKYEFLQAGGEDAAIPST